MRWLKSVFRGFFTLLLAGCLADNEQVFLHPDVEQRVQESLRLEPPLPPACGDTFEFAVFGDIHIGKRVGGYLEDLRRHRDSLGIRFFCVLGDITENGTVSEYDSAYRALGALGPTYLTVGNHDLYSRGSWEDYKRHFGPATYALKVGRLKLIFFDTAEGEVGATQFDWLTDELDDTASVQLVLTHFPLYDGSTPGIFRLGSYTERLKLFSLLRKNRVYGYCAGHIHGWRHIELDGVHHFTVGTMSRALDFGMPGYLLFHCRGDSIDWEFVRFCD